MELHYMLPDGNIPLNFLGNNLSFLIFYTI